MTRSMPAVCGLFLTAATALAAPGAKTGDGPLYYPTAVGATAVYESTAGKLTMETTDKVTDVTKTADGLRVTVERSSPSGFKAVTQQMDVSAKGLAHVQFGGRDFDPPVPVLRFPAKPGDAWEWEARKADALSPRKIKFKVVGEEEVEVPAGKFNAIRIEQEEEARLATRSDEWYAPKVGLVKRAARIGAIDQVQVLKSFTPGKE